MKMIVVVALFISQVSFAQSRTCLTAEPIQHDVNHLHIYSKCKTIIINGVAHEIPGTSNNYEGDYTLPMNASNEIWVTSKSGKSGDHFYVSTVVTSSGSGSTH